MRYVFIILLLSFYFLFSTGYEANANSRYAGLVIDGDSGSVLYQENAGKLRHPASLTKMMTLYLTFDALQHGKLTMSQRLYVSSRAALQPQSKMGLRQGERITVRDAIMSLIIKSANDSAVVLAEAVGGTEWQFSLMMTRMAEQLGMKNTRFRNASGLHDKKQVTTAYDLARLAVALRRDFPKYYELFSATSFPFRGETYYTHNRILKKYKGADGLKTGYINASGYNLVTTVTRNDDHLVGVVLGGRTTKSRDSHMMKILDKGYYKLAKLKSSPSYAKNTTPKPILKPGRSAIPAATEVANPAASPDIIYENVPQPHLKPEIAQGDN